MVPQRDHHEYMVYREQPRSQKKVDDLRLEWKWHIPFTSKKKGKKYILVEERAPNVPPRAPPSPPATPIYIEPNVVPISPRLPVREHQQTRLLPARERSPGRIERIRQEDRRLAERRAALDAYIEELRARQARHEAERAEASREARIREIDDEIARIQAELNSSQRRRRAAEGNFIHQESIQERRRYDDGVRVHRGDFRISHQDAGGGGIKAGEAGLGGGRHARQRSEEIRNLEKQLKEEGGRRRGGALASNPNAGRHHNNLLEQPLEEFVRINNKNGWARM